jgi:hypothetical protein
MLVAAAVALARDAVDLALLARSDLVSVHVGRTTFSKDLLLAELVSAFADRLEVVGGAYGHGSVFI